jgi:hypothetical protein
MRRPRKAEGAFPTVEKYNELVDIVNYLMDNALVTAGSGLSTQQMPQGRAVVSNVDVNLKFYRLIGAEPIDDVSWMYSVEEVRYTLEGWELVEVPKSFYPALNTAEENGLATDPVPQDTIVSGRKTPDIGTGYDGVLFTYNVGEGSQLGLTPGIILSSSAASQTGKWIYSWAEATFNASTVANAYDSWTTVAEYGITGTAFNDAEVADGENHEAIPDGTIIRVHTHIDPDDGTPYYWFNSPRGGAGGTETFTALVVTSELTGDDGQWRYKCVKAQYIGSDVVGYGGWSILDGEDPEDDQFDCFNDVEEPAAAYYYRPIPDGTVIRVRTVPSFGDYGSEETFWCSCSMNQDTNTDTPADGYKTLQLSPTAGTDADAPWDLTADFQKGLILSVVGTVWWDANGGIWKQNLWEMTFDDGGRLVKVEAGDTQIIVETVEC